MSYIENNPRLSFSRWLSGNGPRERLLCKGPQYLSDAELLALILRSGTRKSSVLEMSQSLLNSAGGFRGILNGPADFFRSQHGLGDAKIAALLSLAEILNRALRESMLGQSYVSEPQAVLDFLSFELRDKKRECFKVLLLDSANRVIHEKTLFEGTVNQTTVYTREIIKYALDHHAVALILVHNHPSGVCKPSQDDKTLTSKVARSCADMTLKVLDHLIIGDNRYYSFKENGLI